MAWVSPHRTHIVEVTREGEGKEGRRFYSELKQSSFTFCVHCFWGKNCNVCFYLQLLCFYK